ncbi:hypothetical protein BJX76DRAFT_328989 [Aspergillus varians]
MWIRGRRPNGPAPQCCFQAPVATLSTSGSRRASAGCCPSAISQLKGTKSCSWRLSPKLALSIKVSRSCVSKDRITLVAAAIFLRTLSLGVNCTPVTVTDPLVPFFNAIFSTMASVTTRRSGHFVIYAL